MALYKAKDAPWSLNHSRQLDVHTWSDHPEVNKFIDIISHGEGEVTVKEVLLELLKKKKDWSKIKGCSMSFKMHE